LGAPGESDLNQRLHVIDNAEMGVTGVIAIHSTALGPAAGGCRFWHYASKEDLARDAARLARGMSYKNAMAELPFGGGKAVLQRPNGAFDRATVFRVFADAVAALDGAYVTAEDVGTTIADMKAVRKRTQHVAGLDALPGKAGGDPSPWTALGVFKSMEAAARIALRSDLRGLTVAVQGCGNVGQALCELLAAAGARLIIADIDGVRAGTLAAKVGAKVVEVEEILSAGVDILAPCALGGILNEATIPFVRAALICGGANNQLANEESGEALLARGIVYAPDYVVNAGGIINVAAEYLSETTEQVAFRVGQIAPRLSNVLERAAQERRPTNIIADTMARQLISDASRAAN
jgi:leucine dehydrogenase